MSNISIKTPAQIKSMRTGGKYLAEILNTLKNFVQPGQSTLDLENKAQELFKSKHLVPSFQGYNGFPAALCVSLNDEVVHGIPKADRIIRSGDLVKIDCGVYYEGMHTDSAITVAVGQADSKALTLADTTRAALLHGISFARAGNHLGDIGAAIQDTLETAGFGVVRECVGHGIGTHLHEDPNVPNYGQPGTGPLLKAGMTLAIEPISTLGDYRISELDDGWTIITRDGSLSAHVEHTILITDNEPEIFTLI